MKKITFFLSIIVIVLVSTNGYSFDLISKNKSYEGPRFLTMGLGLGFSSIKGYKSVSGNQGFSFEVSVGHEFTQSLSLDFAYKFSLIDMISPNPLNTSQNVISTVVFNAESLRLMYRHSAYNFQPYIFGGVGLYGFASVDQKTAMSFPANFQLPLGAGFLLYLFRDQVSFRAGFDWHILFGEDQKANVKTLLNVNKVSFDVYSVMFAVTWHVF